MYIDILTHWGSESCVSFYIMVWLLPMVDHFGSEDTYLLDGPSFPVSQYKAGPPEHIACISEAC